MLEPVYILSGLNWIQFNISKNKIFLPQKKIASLESYVWTFRSKWHLCFSMRVLDQMLTLSSVAFAQFDSRSVSLQHMHNVEQASPVFGSPNASLLTDKALHGMVNVHPALEFHIKMVTIHASLTGWGGVYNSRIDSHQILSTTFGLPFARSPSGSAVRQYHCSGLHKPSKGHQKSSCPK